MATQTSAVNCGAGGKKSGGQQTQVVSPAGTPDLVCELADYPGLVCVVDYKTSHADEVYPAWSAQVAAYAFSDEVQALFDCGAGEPLASVLRINWETLEEPVLTFVPKLRQEFELFKYLLAAHNYLAKRPKLAFRARPQVSREG